MSLSVLLLTDKRHKGEVVSSLSQLSVRDSAAELASVDHLSLSDDDISSLHSSLPCNDDDNPSSSCARTCYVLPVERWSGKRKRRDEAHGSKHVKTSKPMWVEGLSRSADESQTSITEGQSRIDGGAATPAGHVGTPSPTKSNASSSAASSPVKLPDKRVPATKAQPPPPLPAQMSPVLHLKKLSAHEMDIDVKARPPDGDAGKRTRQSLSDSSSKTSAESTTKSRLSVAESGTRGRSSAAASKSVSSSSAMSPTSAAVSSIVGMSPPATPVMPEPHMTPSHRQSKQKGRAQRDPNSLPCKGNRIEFAFDDFIITAVCDCD